MKESILSLALILFSAGPLFAQDDVVTVDMGMMEQFPDSTKQGYSSVMPDVLSVSYGENPLVSGLTAISTWLLPNDRSLTLSLNKGDGYAVYAKTWSGERSHLTVGASGGFMAQVPWIGPYFEAGYGPLGIIVWTGPEYGSVDRGSVLDEFGWMFTYLEASARIGWFQFSETLQKFEERDVNLLTSAKIGIPVKSGLTLDLQTTLQENDNWNPMFLIGVTMTR